MADNGLHGRVTQAERRLGKLERRPFASITGGGSGGGGPGFRRGPQQDRGGAPAHNGGLYLAEDVAGGRLTASDGTSWTILADNVLSNFQVLTPVDNAVEIDVELGTVVWIIVNDDCGIAPPLNAEQRDELVLIIQQDSVGGHGVLFDPIFGSPPTVGVGADEQTVARYHYLGNFGGTDWVNTGGGGAGGSAPGTRGSDTYVFGGENVPVASGTSAFWPVERAGNVVMAEATLTVAGTTATTVQVYLNDTDAVGDPIVLGSGVDETLVLLDSDTSPLHPAAATDRLNVRTVAGDGAEGLTVVVYMNVDTVNAGPVGPPGLQGPPGISVEGRQILTASDFSGNPDGIVIDPGAGTLVWILVDEDCSVGIPAPAPDADSGAELRLIFSQVDTESHGVLWVTGTGGWVGYPNVDPFPGANTTAEFWFNGLGWIYSVPEPATSTVSRPAVTLSMIPEFADARSGMNTASNSQDCTTIGAAIGSDQQYQVFHRRGVPYLSDAEYGLDYTLSPHLPGEVRNGQGYAVIAKHTLPGGKWELHVQDSPAWIHEMGGPIVEPVDFYNELGEQLHKTIWGGGLNSHRTTSIATSIDGFTHIAGNGHSEWLHYLRSVHPEGHPDHLDVWCAPGMITPRTTGTDVSGATRPTDAAYIVNNEYEVTYPSFVRLNDDDGTLLFFHRENYSGDSRGWCMNRYAPSGTPGVAGTWSRIGGAHFLVSDHSSVTSPTTSFYPNRFVAHPTQDKVAMFGTWRISSDPAANRDLDFAWLTDLAPGGDPPGATKADGTVLSADLAATPLSRAGAGGTAEIEHIFTTGASEMTNSGGSDIDHLGFADCGSLYLLDPQPVGTAEIVGPVIDPDQGMQLGHVWWNGAKWCIQKVTNLFNTFDTFVKGPDGTTFTAGEEQELLGERQVLLTGVPIGHGIDVGDWVNIDCDDIGSPFDGLYKVTARGSTSIAYGAPEGLAGSDDTTGGGRIIPSSVALFSSNPLFCANEHTYVTYNAPVQGHRDHLWAIDVTDPDNLFEFPLARDVGGFHSQLDSRSLAERREYHSFQNPVVQGVYADCRQYQTAAVLSIDLEQMNLVAGRAAVLPKIVSVRSAGLGLYNVFDDEVSHPGYGVRSALDSAWRPLTEAIPIGPDLDGKLVFARLTCRLRSANTVYAGRAHIRYVVGGDANQMGSVITGLGSVSPQMLTTGWVPIPDTRLYDGLTVPEGGGFVQARFRCDVDYGTIWSDLATLEIGVLENVSGNSP